MAVGKEFACNAGDLYSIPGWEDLLEEGMATHSRMPGESPWTEELSGLQSMGSQTAVSPCIPTSKK